MLQLHLLFLIYNFFFHFLQLPVLKTNFQHFDLHKAKNGGLFQAMLEIVLQQQKNHFLWFCQTKVACIRNKSSQQKCQPLEHLENTGPFTLGY